MLQLWVWLGNCSRQSLWGNVEGGSRGVSRAGGSSLGQLKGWEHARGFLWAWGALSGMDGQGAGGCRRHVSNAAGRSSRTGWGQTKKGGMR